MGAGGHPGYHDAKKAEEYLDHLGTDDVLTGLYNRADFQERLLHLENERQDPVSIILADLNDLKQTNHCGHDAGDNLIRRAGEVLRASFDDETLVARIGGDEFIVGVARSRRWCRPRTQ